MELQFLVLLIIPILLSGWYWLHFREYEPGAPGGRSDSTKLFFPFIESYRYYKSAAQKAASDGTGAETYIKKILAQAPQDSPAEHEAAYIFREFTAAMCAWSQHVDKHVGDDAQLKRASDILEREIEQIAHKCERLGWTFREEWRE
jgi:hypothetical protein